MPEPGMGSQNEFGSDSGPGHEGSSGGGGADLSGFEGSPEHGGYEDREIMTAIATQLGLEQRGLHDRDNTWVDRLLNWGQDFQQRHLGNPRGLYPDHPAQNQIENVWGHGPVLDAAFNAARRGTSLQEIADRIAPREGGGAIGPQGSLDNLIVVPAGFTNPAPGSIFRDERGDVQIVLPTGQAVAVRAVDNVIRIIRRGGSLNANQRAMIDAMTPAQQRAAGIFLAPDGTARPFREVLSAAVTNAAAGRSLSTNQQAALGLAFNNIPSSGARRDAINALAGSARGRVRDNISAAVGQAMRAAADLRREARRQTEAQTLKTAGVKRPREAIARLAAAGVTHQAAGKILRLKAAGVARPVSQVERLAAQGVRNPVQRLIAQADRRDKAAATAAGTSVNRLRALRAAGVQQPAQKVAQLKAAGVRRPVQKLARLRQAGVKRATQKLVQLKTAGVQRPAQKIAALRRAGIERGVQKVAQLKAVGVTRPVAKLAQLQQAGVKRPAQQLVQLKQAGVRRPAQKLLAQAPAQRGALGKQTRQIIRTTNQSLTFKTAGGQTRTAAQVAANAARNKAGRPLTPNQKRLLAAVR